MTDVLAPVEKLLDEMLCESDDWTVIETKMVEDSREAVRLLLDVAREWNEESLVGGPKDQRENYPHITALLAFARQLEADRA